MFLNKRVWDLLIFYGHRKVKGTCKCGKGQIYSLVPLKWYLRSLLCPTNTHEQSKLQDMEISKFSQIFHRWFASNFEYFHLSLLRFQLIISHFLWVLDWVPTLLHVGQVVRMSHSPHRAQQKSKSSFEGSQYYSARYPALNFCFFVPSATCNKTQKRKEPNN